MLLVYLGVSKMETLRLFRRPLILGAILFCLAARMPAPSMGSFIAETLTYREVEGGAVATHVLSVRPEGPGFRVELATTRADGVVRQTFRTAADHSTLAWTFSDPVRRLELAAAVQGEDIVLSGTFQGKKVDKEFTAAGPPWNQLFQMGLGPFALSGRKSMSVPLHRHPGAGRAEDRQDHRDAQGR